MKGATVFVVDDDLSVRLDTTQQEDDWLRRLAERELGTGQPMMPPSPTTHKPALSAPDDSSLVASKLIVDLGRVTVTPPAR